MAILPGMGPRNQLPGSSPTPATRAADRTVKFRMRGALKYTFLPEIGPRIKRLGKSFGHFAYMLALVFRSARLLPANHPMLLSVNIGRYGIVDVISAAANNLIISKKNIDQILIFGAIILAVIMVFIQIVIIGFYSVMMPNVASAQDGMFTTPNPNEDAVLTFLQQTIGLDGFFNSKSPIGFSIAGGLRAMLGFYSTGLMLIATCIVVYYVITVVGESAQSGTPFGRRFNGLWAPVRLVLALGLLVPLGNGLNAAQYVALHVAKAGSGFATQAWNKFSNEIKSTKYTLAQVYPDGFTNVAKAVFMYEVCMHAYNAQQTDPANKIVPRTRAPDIEEAKVIYSYVPAPSWWGGNIWEDAKDGKGFFYEWSVLRSDGSNVKKFSCGQLNIGILNTKYDPAGKDIATVAIKAYSEAIFKLSEKVREQAKLYAESITPNTKGFKEGVTLPPPTFLVQAIREVDQQTMDKITAAAPDFGQKAVEQALGKDWEKGGWGNAATFYMKVAFANQKVNEQIKGTFPIIDDTQSAQSSVAATMSSEDTRGFWTRYVSSWFWAESAKPQYSELGKQAESIAKALETAHKAVNSTIPPSTASLASASGMANLKIGASWDSGNQFYKIIKSLFAIDEIAALVDPNQQNIFPMVKLSNIGGALINRVAIVFGAATLASTVSTAVAQMIFFIGLIGLGIGFLLFYVLPFMPFIYFFFAIVEWGMGVLEAMVGAPLWALAHLRIDGDGMPGQAAMQGYNILLSILLRPFLILFGLLASYVCFNSAANFLNIIFWGSVGVRTNDGAQLGPLSLVGYVIVYAIIVYNLGLVCFKMIDQIPNQALRWMSVQDGSYKDGKADPIGQISGAAMTAGTIVTSQVAGQAAQIGSAAGAAGKGIGKAGMNFVRGKSAGKGKGKGGP